MSEPIPKRLVIPRQVWDKYHLPVQERLLKDYDEIVFEESNSEPSFKQLSGKKKALKILNHLDWTTKEGKGSYDKYLTKFENGFKKFDEIMDKVENGFDNATASLDKGLGGGVDGKKRKTALDDPFGKGDIDGVVK